MKPPHGFDRRQFITGAVATWAVSRLPAAEASAAPEPIIDIHQHTNYGGGRDAAFRPILPLPRGHDALRVHQRGLGVTKTILLPAGRPVSTASTHSGKSNGLDGTVSGNDDVVALARAHPGEFVFGANEVSDLPDAPQVVERFLKLGAVLIGEQKFGVDCDSPAMHRLYALAQEYRVPVLLHWQVGSYNHGFERFHRVLEKYPTVNFIGHAQTWWANIDAAYVDDPKNLYPTGPVRAGGLTDRYLRDYANMFGDLSAGSGENAFKRDPEHARGFFARHQDKLMFGSDCNDPTGEVAVCSGARQLAQIRKFAPDKIAERKMLYENARKIFRL